MAINQLLKNKDEIIRLCEKVMNKRCDISGLEDQKAKLQAELEVTCGLNERRYGNGSGRVQPAVCGI